MIPLLQQPHQRILRGVIQLAVGDVLRRLAGSLDRRGTQLVQFAERQGFSIALIPDGDDPRRDIVPSGMRALRAPTIVAALQHMVDIADHRKGWTHNALGPHNDTL